MRRAFFAFGLFLFLACSLSLGASATDLKSLESPRAASVAQPIQLIPSPIPMTSCTVSCWWDPNISCTSQAGLCQHQDLKGTEIIRCDGVPHLCPGP